MSRAYKSSNSGDGDVETTWAGHNGDDVAP